MLQICIEKKHGQTDYFDVPQITMIQKHKHFRNV